MIIKVDIKTMIKLLLRCGLILFVAINANDLIAQTPPKPTSGQIYKSIEKLNFLGTALFVAAHPDDENTRLISYLANHTNAETYYLSLTRGDGGQNLIGPEIYSLLGLLRTQELLAARRTDNGKQLFSRAIDFGFSKNAEETIDIWDSEKVKEDVVWAIRKVRPDVIVNRFDHRSSGTTHGHHTASGMLSHQLFEKSNDPNVYPQQLKYVKPWQARRLFFNTSWWFYGSEEAFEKADKTNLMSVDLGVYIPLLGLSNTEIAALSRSNHRCQGFGSSGTRGESLDYLELLKGDMPKLKKDIFEGINTTWSRIPEGVAIQKIMDKVLKEYNFVKPELAVPDLIKARGLIGKISDEFWRERKTKEIDQIIADCLGLFIEADTKENYTTKGSAVEVTTEIVSRNAPIVLKKIKLNPSNVQTPDTVTNLKTNQRITKTLSFKVDQKQDYTSPYWLRKPGSLGVFTVDDQALIGLPETPRPYTASITIEINGTPITYTKDLVYKYTDPERGEVYQPFEVIPAFSVGIKEKVIIFPDEKSKTVTVEVKSYEENKSGTLSLALPINWKCEPASYPVAMKIKGETQTYTFVVTPSIGTEVLQVNPVLVDAMNNVYNEELRSIDYQHVPLQRVLMPGSTKLVKLDLKKRGENIAYIMGTGDDIPQSLRQIGYKVDMLEVAEISKEKLQGYDAVIMGIRAYNKHEDLKFKQQIIFDYVKSGGNFVVQYNTNGRDLVLKPQEILPYAFSLSRERVTVENSPVTILAKDHPIVNGPNKIVPSDFDGWIQERGLYFPNSWAKEYTSILSCNDPGEPARDGGLIVAPYGQGNIVYTGYSWFRQLPDGVPGAIRLFTNIISLDKHKAEVRP
jgi:LmbE family N-acetylglucosaminyl deacetylase